jgi:hypothetical protein
VICPLANPLQKNGADKLLTRIGAECAGWLYGLFYANHFVAARRLPDDDFHCRLAHLSGGDPLHAAI